MKNSDLEKTVVDAKSLHHLVGYIAETANTHTGLLNLLPRESLCNLVWKRMSPSTAVIIASPTNDGRKQITAKRVRIENSFFIKLDQLPYDRCKITYILNLDLGEAVPRKVLRHNTQGRLQLTDSIQQYFQHIRPLNLLDEQDGVPMAEAFMLSYTKQEKHNAKDFKHSLAYTRVRAVIASHTALKEYNETNPWFSELMIGVVSNKLLGSSGAVNSKLLTLSLKESRKIGNSLASILLSSTSSELAVEEWTLAFDATQELDMRLVWFRPMMNRIAMR